MTFIDPRLMLAVLLMALLAISRPALADDVEDAAKMLKSGQHQQALERVNKVLAAKPREARARLHSGDQNLAEWSGHKRKVNAAKSWITVAVSKVAMLQDPRENFVVVSFDQDYRSSNLSNVMRKRQYWIKDDGRWRILYEGGA